MYSTRFAEARNVAGRFKYALLDQLLESLVFRPGVLEVMDREALREYCGRRGQVWTFGASEEVHLTAPINDERFPTELRGDSDVKRLDRPFVCEIEDATLFGPGALAAVSDGRVVLETTENADRTMENRNNRRHLVSNYLDRLRHRGGPTRSFEVCCPLVDPWSDTYFHWIVDGLARLQGVERYVEETGRKPTLLIPSSPPEWMRRLLELAGYDPDSCVEWSGGTAAVDRLVVPTLRRDEHTPSPGALRWLADRLLANASREVDASKFSSRVYISRREADNRRVLNEPELTAALREHGFREYVLEGMTIDEQIGLFSQADVVLGPHGSGFTNMLFGSDLTVIELFGSEVPSKCYYHMASGLGFEYGAVRCRSRVGNLLVDVDRLQNLIEKVLVAR